MIPLKVGERVRTYEHLSIREGVIDAIDTKGNIRLEKYSLWYHPKQCRRLKPRAKPREIWIGEFLTGNLSVSVCLSKQECIDEFPEQVLKRVVKFVEVTEESK